MCDCAHSAFGAWKRWLQIDRFFLPGRKVRIKSGAPLQRETEWSQWGGDREETRVVQVTAARPGSFHAYLENLVSGTVRWSPWDTGRNRTQSSRSTEKL